MLILNGHICVLEMPKTDSRYLVDRLVEVFTKYGLPNMIVSDNGPQITSSEYLKFCNRNSIKVVTSSPFHPSINGTLFLANYY